MTRAVIRLRPFVYPMVRFLGMPSGKTNFHYLVNEFVLALKRELGPRDLIELGQFLGAIDFKSAPYPFTQYALKTSVRLVEEGHYKNAVELISHVPISPDKKHEQTVYVNMQIAKLLIKDLQYKHALEIYRRLERMGPSHVYDRVNLWSAYCHLELDNLKLVRLYLSRTSSLTRKSRFFSLHYMVVAKLSLREQQYRDAMYNIALSTTLGKVVDDWMPESLFTLGICYEKLKQPKGAAKIYKEVEFLYPEKKFAKLASKRLKQVPQDGE